MKRNPNYLLPELVLIESCYCSILRWYSVWKQLSE